MNPITVVAGVLLLLGKLKTNVSKSVVVRF